MAPEGQRTFRTMAEYKAAYNTHAHDAGAEAGLTHTEIASIIARSSLDVVRRSIAGEVPTAAPTSDLERARISTGLSTRQRPFPTGL